MNSSRAFVVNFGSLPAGEHEFEFHVGDTFFQQFENSIIENGDVDVLVVLEKKEHLLLIDFTMQGTITLPCDRCLEDIELELESHNELIVKQGADKDETSEDVIVISPREYELDLAPFIYEYLTVSLPLRVVHEDEEGRPACDPEILKELEKHLSHSDSEEKEDEPATDPRWDILKNINLN